MLHKQFYDAQSIFELFSVSFEAYEDVRLLSLSIDFLSWPAHLSEHRLLNRSLDIHQDSFPEHKMEERKPLFFQHVHLTSHGLRNCDELLGYPESGIL